MRRTAVVVLLVASLVVPALAFAEDAPRPITVASFFKVMPGKGETVMELFKKYDKPVLDKLMAEGTITGWGVGRPWVHTNGAWNLLFWINALDMGAHEKVDQAFEVAEKGRSAAENKKIEDTFYAAVAMDAHRDGVYRQVAGKAGRPPASPEGKGYLWLAYYTAKSAKGDDVTSFFGAVVQPVMDKLVADAVIGSYGLVIPTVHLAGAPTHIAWYWVDSLASIDKVQAALRGAREKRSSEQNAELDARADGIFEPGTHFDDLVQVAMSGVK
jgi:hypothetical protein